MTQEINCYIEGSPAPKPHSKCTVYVDGTADASFRKSVDHELSHWRPNQTDVKYKAGTSTEICFKFLKMNKTIPYDLVINNHLDVDGVLSVFVLTHPQTALQYQKTLIQAAEAGDFSGWAEGKALKIFQELSLLFKKFNHHHVEINKAYKECFSVILTILKDPYIFSKAEDILIRQSNLVEKGDIYREELSPRLVSYHVPRKTVSTQEEKFLRTPKFNEPITGRLAFWPHVRNRLDAEKIHLVSFETDRGIHYDLWFPGYTWADTEGLWNPPGLMPPSHIGGTYTFRWDQLTEVVAQLNSQEGSECRWETFQKIAFLRKQNPRDFPIVMSTLNKHSQGRGSKIPLKEVKEMFKVCQYEKSHK